MSHLTPLELEQLLMTVQKRCDPRTINQLQRLLSENRELRDQHAERQFMYDLDPSES